MEIKEEELKAYIEMTGRQRPEALLFLDRECLLIEMYRILEAPSGTEKTLAKLAIEDHLKNIGIFGRV